MFQLSQTTLAAVLLVASLTALPVIAAWPV